VARESLISGPVDPASASGFYETLLENRRWWGEELESEGMNTLSLPSPASTNGTWLAMQATHAIVKSMITRETKWHPRYAVFVLLMLCDVFLGGAIWSWHLLGLTAYI
jgi:hypothetical protein